MEAHGLQTRAEPDAAAGAQARGRRVRQGQRRLQPRSLGRQEDRSGGIQRHGHKHAQEQSECVHSRFHLTSSRLCETHENVLPGTISVGDVHYVVAKGGKSIVRSSLGDNGTVGALSGKTTNRALKKTGSANTA